MTAGRLSTAVEVRRFLLGGKAVFTLVSTETGTRFTFKARQPEEPNDPRKGTPTWISLLTGADNETHYTHLGTVWLERTDREDLYLKLPPQQRRKLSYDAPSVLAFRWFLKQLNQGALPPTVEVWHEGRCGRCGRTLTVPSSIATGFGPECAQIIGLEVAA